MASYNDPRVDEALKRISALEQRVEELISAPKKKRSAKNLGINDEEKPSSEVWRKYTEWYKAR